MQQPVQLVSSSHFPGEVEHKVVVAIKGKQYEYRASALVADRFEWMLKQGGGFRALNYLKKNSELVKDCLICKGWRYIFIKEGIPNEAKPCPKCNKNESN